MYQWPSRIVTGGCFRSLPSENASYINEGMLLQSRNVSPNLEHSLTLTHFFQYPLCIRPFPCWHYEGYHFHYYFRYRGFGCGAQAPEPRRRVRLFDRCQLRALMMTTPSQTLWSSFIHHG